MYTDIFPNRINAFPFAIQDLQSIIVWAASRPDVWVRVTAAGSLVRGVVEIYQREAPQPRWCMWLTADGRLQLDDLLMSEFALPYPMIGMALRFIESRL